jgi:hypothetical protein
MKTLSFKDFQATREIMTVKEYNEKWGFIEEEGMEIEQVFAYEGGLHLELMNTGEFYLLIESSDWLGYDLTTLEKRLYEWGDGEAFEAINYVDYDLLIAASRNNDLDSALRPLQEAIGQNEGDEAGLYFSGDINAETWPQLTDDARLKHLEAYLEQEKKNTSASGQSGLRKFEIRKLKSYRAVFFDHEEVLSMKAQGYDEVVSVAKYFDAFTQDEAMGKAEKFASLAHIEVDRVECMGKKV